eukprot:GHVS01062830.1.p2 GENE.GHVS01062830.1~~GHVS01062830.1.p2  ORF type:complete len:111 (-),score=8.90 GHVS01062830.1:131-463(-)
MSYIYVVYICVYMLCVCIIVCSFKGSRFVSVRMPCMCVRTCMRRSTCMGSMSMSFLFFVANVVLVLSYGGLSVVVREEKVYFWGQQHVQQIRCFFSPVLSFVPLASSQHW